MNNTPEGALIGFRTISKDKGGPKPIQSIKKTEFYGNTDLQEPLLKQFENCLKELQEVARYSEYEEPFLINMPYPDPKLKLVIEGTRSTACKFYLNAYLTNNQIENKLPPLYKTKEQRDKDTQEATKLFQEEYYRNHPEKKRRLLRKTMKEELQQGHWISNEDTIEENNIIEFTNLGKKYIGICKSTFLDDALLKVYLKNMDVVWVVVNRYTHTVISKSINPDPKFTLYSNDTL